MLKQKESYLGNPNVKRDGVLQQWTPDLLQEYKKCMDNPVYFVEKLCKGYFSGRWDGSICLISISKGYVQTISGE